MEQFSEYGHALVAVAICAVMAQVLNALTGLKKHQQGLTPGKSVEPDYNDPVYRFERTYMNSMETLPFFAVLVFAAILAGASPFWVNVGASMGLLSRIAQNYIFIKGIGQPYSGIRTRLAALSALVNVALFLTVLCGVFF